MELTEIKSEIQKDIDKINDAGLLDALRIFIETHLLNPPSNIPHFLNLSKYGFSS